MADSDREPADELLRVWEAASNAAREIFKKGVGLVESERTIRAHVVIKESSDPTPVKTVTAVYRKDT